MESFIFQAFKKFILLSLTFNFKFNLIIIENFNEEYFNYLCFPYLFFYNQIKFYFNYYFIN